MSHAHEWATSSGYTPIYCVICDNAGIEKTMGPDEIERRLNATERLSAEDAIITAVDIQLRLPNKEGTRLKLALDTYAAALEGVSEDS